MVERSYSVRRAFDGVGDSLEDAADNINNPDILRQIGKLTTRSDVIGFIEDMFDESERNVNYSITEAKKRTLDLVKVVPQSSLPRIVYEIKITLGSTKSFAESLFSGLPSFFSGLWGAVKKAATYVKDKVVEYYGTVKKGIKKLFNWLTS
jgi:hypothetical protein